MKIIVTAETNDEFRGVSDITFPVMAEYCARHGYEFRPFHITRPIRSIVWDRVLSIRDALTEAAWAVHIDADCLITNLHVPLTEFIVQSASFVISRCFRESGGAFFNDGFFMVQNTGTALEYLCRGWDMADASAGILCFQDAFEVLADEDDFFPIVASVQPQKRFNSFLYTEYGMPASTPGHWTPGDFLLHLPGRTNERRVEIFRETLGRVLR